MLIAVTMLCMSARTLCAQMRERSTNHSEYRRLRVPFVESLNTRAALLAQALHIHYLQSGGKQGIEPAVILIPSKYATPVTPSVARIAETVSWRTLVARERTSEKESCIASGTSPFRRCNDLVSGGWPEVAHAARAHARSCFKVTLPWPHRVHSTSPQRKQSLVESLFIISRSRVQVLFADSPYKRDKRCCSVRRGAPTKTVRVASSLLKTRSIHVSMSFSIADRQRSSRGRRLT